MNTSLILMQHIDLGVDPGGKMCHFILYYFKENVQLNCQHLGSEEVVNPLINCTFLISATVNNLKKPHV